MVWDYYPIFCRWCHNPVYREQERHIYYCSTLCYLQQCRKNMLGIKCPKPGHLKRIEIYNQEIDLLESCKDGTIPEGM